MSEGIKCPHCGKSHYTTSGGSLRTCMGWTPEYKDGKLVNQDPNITSTRCHCCECEKDFVISEQYGKITVKKMDAYKGENYEKSNI